MTTISIRDVLMDMSKVMVSTGFFDKVKITADKKGTSIESLDKDKTVILKATTLKPVDGWEGEFGLGNLALLSSICNDSEFNHKDSKIEMVYQQKNGVDVPSELSYVNKSKTFISYRFMGKELVPDQPKYIEPSWDVKIRPSKANIQQFNWVANSLTSYEQYFFPKTVNGDLKFFIGDEGAASQRGGTVFAAGVTGNFDSNHKWPIGLVTSVLKLVEGTDAEMSFSVKGAIQLKLDTGIGEYKYILPAKIK